MTILEILSLKFCLLCIKHGKWICNNCSNHFINHIPLCYRCGKVSKGSTTHKGCSKRRRETGVNYTLTSLICGYLYNRQTRKYLKYIKFKSSWQIANEIVSKMLPRVREYLLVQKIDISTTVVIPVPLHSSRMRRRGFNQSEIVAKKISKELGIYLNRSILRKVKNTQPQTKVAKKKRMENIRNAFICTYSKEIYPYLKDIILVDDVLTTGATLESCTESIRLVYPNVRVHGLVLFRPNIKRGIDKFVPNGNRKEIKAKFL